MLSCAGENGGRGMDSRPGGTMDSGPLGDSTSFLAGGGEMGALMRLKDWSQSPLGAPDAWPQSLKTVVRIMLTSRYAMWMAWGPELSFFYNDAYRPTLGVKHPQALGVPAPKVWAEIWQDIGPRIGAVLDSGEATWEQALLLFLERSGYREETYHTFSYSPLADEGRARYDRVADRRHGCLARGGAHRPRQDHGGRRRAPRRQTHQWPARL